MPKLFTLGSINIDHVYRMPHFVQPGETLGSLQYECFPGGKGLNQSIAAARAGASVFHIGALNAKDADLLSTLSDAGVDTHWVMKVPSPTGHAMIQTVPSGENAIVLYPGANFALTEGYIENALRSADAGDYLLLQNETNLVEFAMLAAHRKGMKIAFNPAPMDERVRDYPLALVSLFFLNQTEAAGLAGDANPELIKRFLSDLSAQASAVVTLGGDGAFLVGASGDLTVAGCSVNVVDTTAAGDTFVGYYLASLLAGESSARALQFANRAAALCVQREGAAPSIPVKAQVESVV